MKYITLVLFAVNMWFLYRLYYYSRLIENYRTVLKNGKTANYLVAIEDYLDEYESVKSFKLSMNRRISEQAIISNVLSNGVHADDAYKFVDFYKKVHDGQIMDDEIRVRIKENEDYSWTYAYLTVISQRFKRPAKIAVTINENSAINRLTGLYSTSIFTEKAKAMLDGDGDYALALIDLKDFKHFNEINGFQVGDDMLQHITQILMTNKHHNELLGHINSDNFIMLINRQSISDYQMRFNKVVNSIRQFEIDNDHRFTIDPLIGIIEIADDMRNIDLMIELVTMIKRNHLKRYDENIILIDQVLLDKAKRTIQMEKTMETSLRNREFEVYVQPKYHLSSGTIIGGEALVRWNHQGKVMQPGEFLPLFESNGFICRIDYYMFDEVCKFLKAQIDNGQPAKPISVNFSRLHLYNKTWIKDLCVMAEKHQIPKALLEIELTETIAIDNQALLVKTISELREVGFWVSMDDFGSGYSSLGMLKNLKFNIIKLDKSFISDFEDQETKVIVENIVNLTKKLNKEIIAEGIETTEQIEFLKQLNCEYAQGYYFAKPMPLNEYLNLVNQAL